MENIFINLCLHDVSEKNQSRWTITPRQLDIIINEINSITHYSHVDWRIYFDDGYSSFYEIYRNYSGQNKNISFICACVTDWIGLPGFLSREHIIELKEMGVKFCSHGTSHTSLAKYDAMDIHTIESPKGGLFRNSLTGKNYHLSEKEIEYQYEISKDKLRETGVDCDEFVFPYGIYNSQSIMINRNKCYYSYLTTCDPGPDLGQMLRPRFLLDSDVSAVDISRIHDNIMCDRGFK